MTRQGDPIAERYLGRPDNTVIRVAIKTNARAAEAMTVIVATGRSEFCEKYFPALEHLGGLGYNGIVFDWRGQGASSRFLADPSRGHVADYDAYFDDLDRVAGLAADIGSGPVCLLGHSMGGHIALRALARWPGRFRGAVLSAPMVRIASSPLHDALFAALSRVAVGLGFGQGYIFGRGPYGPGDEDFDRNVLTHDRARFAQCVGYITADPRLALGGPTWQWLAATQRSIAALRAEAAAGRIASPVLIVSAGDDRVVSSPAQAALVRALPAGELRSVPSAYHELLQETDAMRASFWSYAEPFLARLAAAAGTAGQGAS